MRVIARLNVGGPALHVSYLTEGLQARGYETTLVAGRVGSEEGSMDYAVRDRGIEPVFIRHLQRDIQIRADFGAVYELLRLIRRLRPDVLHTHTAKAGAVGRVAAALAGSYRPKAVVHTFHGHVLRGYFDPRRTAGFLMLEKALARSSDALIAVSPQVRDELVALGVGSPERFEVIRLGLDLDARVSAPPGARAAERARLDISPDAHLVAWLGRMTEIKRVDDLLHAFVRVSQRVPEAELVAGRRWTLATTPRGPERQAGYCQTNPFHRHAERGIPRVCRRGRSCALFGERGNARFSHRGARRRAAGSEYRRRGGCGCRPFGRDGPPRTVR